MSLAILATEENWQAFDDAWTALIASKGPIEELCQAIEVIGSKRRISRCLPTLRIHAESLAENGRASDAAAIVGATRKSIYREYADAIVEGLVKHYGQR